MWKCTTDFFHGFLRLHFCEVVNNFWKNNWIMQHMWKKREKKTGKWKMRKLLLFFSTFPRPRTKPTMLFTCGLKVWILEHISCIQNFACHNILLCSVVHKKWDSTKHDLSANADGLWKKYLDEKWVYIPYTSWTLFKAKISSFDQMVEHTHLKSSLFRSWYRMFLLWIMLWVM